MKVRAIGDDGTLSDEYEPRPTSPVGFWHVGARAGQTVSWMGIRYLVVEDNDGRRIEAS